MLKKAQRGRPGTLAVCCKPSSGAGFVWMETTLERLGSTPSHEEWRPPQGDPTEQLLYQGAEMPEERKPEESLCTKKAKDPKKLEQIFK